MVSLLSPSSGRVVQLEGPQEVGGVLEVGSNSEDLVDQVLNTDDAHLAQLTLDDLVGGDGSAVAIDLNEEVIDCTRRRHLNSNNICTKCIKLFPDERSIC